jgi:hypothetical protein
VKRLITRIRNTDRRRLAISVVLVAVFGSLNWGIAKLAGLIVDSNPHYHGVREAATSGYFIGFLSAFLIASLLTRTGRILISHFGKQAKAAE